MSENEQMNPYLRRAIKAEKKKARDERDAMAWQVFLANQSQPNAQGSDYEARNAYSAVDAFLAERKRQQGEA